MICNNILFEKPANNVSDTITKDGIFDIKAHYNLSESTWTLLKVRYLSNKIKTLKIKPTDTHYGKDHKVTISKYHY